MKKNSFYNNFYINLKENLKKIICLPIKWYRRFISPLFPGCCRYYPTCSTYAITAIMRFGIIKGLYLSIKRVLKCNPFFKGGVDPVPQKFKF